MDNLIYHQFSRTMILKLFLNWILKYITYHNPKEMDRQQKLEYQHKVEEYLSKKNVYDMFEDLLKSLIVKQPDDPLSFLI